jgi:ABC-type transport system involved in multi-copper enzyme maturation permease subunit
MLQIIKIEWLKVKYYRAFWVLLGLAIIVIPASNLIVQDISSRIPEEVKKLLGKGLYDFPIVWQTVADVSSYTSGIFGLLLITLVTNEFTYKTHRQNVIDGWERRDFVLSKLLWVAGFAIIALLVSLLTGLFLGFFYSKEPFSLESCQYLGYYFLQVLVSLSLALLLAMLVKRTGLAIILFLGYVMVLEQILVQIVKRYFGAIGGLFPLQAGDELLPFPIVDKMLKFYGTYDNSVYLLVLLAYMALIVWWIFRKMLRTDL